MVLSRICIVTVFCFRVEMFLSLTPNILSTYTKLHPSSSSSSFLFSSIWTPRKVSVKISLNSDCTHDHTGISISNGVRLRFPKIPTSPTPHAMEWKTVLVSSIKHNNFRCASVLCSLPTTCYNEHAEILYSVCESERDTFSRNLE